MAHRVCRMEVFISDRLYYQGPLFIGALIAMGVYGITTLQVHFTLCPSLERS